MNKKRLFSAFFLFCLTFFVFAQKITELKTDQTFLADYVSKNWTTEDGLPGMTINIVVQDKAGYIWIGTYDGLVRFDGVEFKSFGRSVDPKYDFVSARSMYQASDETLWIGHNDEGLTSIAPDGTITKYTVDDGLPNNKVNFVSEDHSNNIWIGTAAGLCFLTPQKEIVIPQGLVELGQEKIIVASMYCDTAGRMWITTGVENDLFIYENNKLSRYDSCESIKNNSVRYVFQDNAGAFWFGIRDGYAIRIHNTEETIYDIGHDHHATTTVNSIIQDKKGNFWFGTDSGITILHNGSVSYMDKRNALPDDNVSSIIEDNEGNIWIGYNRGGLQKFSPGKFATVAMDTSVNAICEDTLRHVTWLGTDNGVACYKDNQFVENKITELTKGNRVRHVEMTSDNELLISSYSDTPQIVVYPNDEVKVWTTDDGINQKCRVAIKTSWGDYYVGTTGGLSIIHHEDGHITTLTRNDGFENHYIMWIYEDDKKQIWAGTNGGGIHVLKDEKVIKHYSSNEDEGCLAGNVIFKIAKNNDSIWIGTGTGLSRYNAQTDSFSNITSRNGIGTDSVFQMICDYTQTAWMTTNKGIFSASLEEMEAVALGSKEMLNAKYYGASDGLITSGVTSTSLSNKDSSGRIWFTLVDGFAIYDPLKSGKKDQAPMPKFQTYTIDDTTYDYYKDTTIVLAPDTKRISLKFTAFSYVSPENLKFSYMLEGFEKKYSEWTSARTVSYTNLGPGTYKFVVLTQNDDGAVSEPSELTIIKQPYIWQRAWFWFVTVIIVACLVGLLANYGLKLRIKKIEAKTEEERKFNKAIIGAFANCVDGKDTYTNGHSRRVAEYTRMLAQKLGEDKHTVDQFYNIALLHDIGKIGIPDIILQKPGKLTDEEFDIMKSHPGRGYLILKDVQIQEDLAAGARYHHERFDGKGYPDGLAGQNIPWVARIIAVADTFDAMSSTRPYRKSLPEDFIIQEIEKCAGTQFDPVVVEKFLELYHEGAFKDVFGNRE